VSRELLFTVNKNDCEWDYFRASGHGGQHRDKTSNAVRCTHKPSSASATCQEHREQSKNKQVAFRKVAESKEFQAWARIEAQKKMGIQAEIEKRVDEMMKPENIKIEYGVA
jgi:protein subunit release factor B